MNILPPGCKTNDCTGIAADSTSYSLQDALYFNGTPVSVAITCPPGATTCIPGTVVVVTYPPGTFVFPRLPQIPGQPIVLSLTGCQSMVQIVLPPDATTAQIDAAVASIIQQVAQQQAECDEGMIDPAAIFLSDIQSYACLSSNYDATVTADTPGVPVSFNVTGALPPGITLGSTSAFEAFFEGIPTTAGAYNFTVTASVAPTLTLPAGAYGQRTYTVNVVGITTASALTATVDEVYLQALATSGFSGTLIWGIAAGSLPTGLTLNTTTGVISGTPTTLGTSAFTVFVQNETQQCLKEFEITVEDSEVDWSGLTWTNIQIIENPPDSGGVFNGTLEGATLSAFSTSGVGSGGATAQGDGTYTGDAITFNFIIVSRAITGTPTSNIQVLQDAVEILSIQESDLTGPYPMIFPVSVSAGVASVLTVQGWSNGIGYCDASNTSTIAMEIVFEPA